MIYIRSLLLPALSWKIIPQCQNYHFRQSYCVHGRPQTTKSHTSNLLPAERPVGLRTSHGIQPLFSSTLLPICQPTLKIFNNALVAFLYILHELFWSNKVSNFIYFHPQLLLLAWIEWGVWYSPHNVQLSWAASLCSYYCIFAILCTSIRPTLRHDGQLQLHHCVMMLTFFPMHINSLIFPYVLFIGLK